MAGAIFNDREDFLYGMLLDEDLDEEESDLYGDDVLDHIDRSAHIDNQGRVIVEDE